jgi:hypothetical protein
LGWEFAGRPYREVTQSMRWVWRLRADDDGKILKESSQSFIDLESCLEDARKHGYLDAGVGPL